MNEKSSIYQEYSQIKEKKQWDAVYQVRRKMDYSFAEVAFITSAMIHDFFCFPQNVKDASELEAKKCNYTYNESKKLHNKRLNR